MKFEPDRCDECGGEVVGVVEQVQGLALLDPDGQGGYEYAGETKMYWGTQIPLIDEDREVPVQCDSSHEWFATIDEHATTKEDAIAAP
jgi:hypothetical protein